MWPWEGGKQSKGRCRWDKPSRAGGACTGLPPVYSNAARDAGSPGRGRSLSTTHGAGEEVYYFMHATSN